MTDKELYKLCVEYGLKARMWKKKFVALLPEIARRGIHRQKGFATVTEFAAKVGGVGKKTVEAIFQVEKYVKDKPALKKLIPEVGVHKVKVVATMATKENQEELAKKVVEMSKPALEVFARSVRSTPPGWKKRETLSFGVDEEVALELRKFKQKLGTVEWNDVMKKLLNAVKEEPKRTRKSRKIKTTRYVPATKKREVSDKCVFPNCNKSAEELHHPERFSLKSSHKRITPLCKTHHEIAHHGLIGNEEKEPHTWFIKEQPDKNHPKFKIDQKVNKYRQVALL